MRPGAVLVTVLVAALYVTTVSATTMTIGYISCLKNDGRFERFQRYLEAAKTKIGLPAGDEILLRHFAISIRQPNQKEAEKMMSDVTNFVDPTNDPGAALVGCWVRDTKIAIKADTGFPYFTYLSLFPDFVNNKDGDISVERREEKLAMSVTTLTPPINAFARPIMEYLKEKKIQRGVVLVVGAEGQLQFGDGLKDSVKSDDIDLEYVRLTKWSPKRDVKSALIGIRTKTVAHIIVHSTDVEVLTYVIQEARKLNLMTQHYYWYFTYPDFEGLLQYYNMKDDLQNIVNASIMIGMQLVDRQVFKDINMEPTADKAEDVLEDAFYYDASTILLKALKAKTGNPTNYTNTMLTDYISNTLMQDTTHFSGALGNYGRLLPPPDAYKGRMMSRVSGPMTWKGIYYKQRNNNLATSNIAITADVPPKVEVTTPQFEIKNQNNVTMPSFNMDTLHVVAKLDPPLIILDTNVSDASQPRYRGVMVDLMDQYAEELNVKWKIVAHVYNVENYGLAGLHDSETIVDYLREGKADIAMGAFGSNLQRAEIISFTDTTIPCAVSLLMKKPKVPYTIFQFLTPFKTSMWVSIFVVFIVVSILLTIMDILDWTDENFPVRDSFYYVAGVLLSGTTDTNPASFPSRMLVGCFIFFAIVTFQSYTANMAAFLTTRDEFQGIPRTLYDVATRTSKDIIAINNSEILTILDKAKKDPYNQISTRVTRVKDHVEAKRQVLINDSVLISDTSFTEYVTADDAMNECLYMDQEQDADTIRYAFALPFGAEYREALNSAIAKLKKDGKDREIIKEWYLQPPCQIEDGGSGGNLQTKSLTMLEMSGIFITLGGGLILSLLVAIVGELMVRYYYKKPGTNFLGFIGYFAKFPRRIRDILMVWTNAGRRRNAQRKQSKGAAENNR